MFNVDLIPVKREKRKRQVFTSHVYKLTDLQLAA